VRQTLAARREEVALGFLALVLDQVAHRACEGKECVGVVRSLRGVFARRNKKTQTVRANFRGRLRPQREL
jgi:hypothetical protein